MAKGWGLAPFPHAAPMPVFFGRPRCFGRAAASFDRPNRASSASYGDHRSAIHPFCFGPKHSDPRFARSQNCQTFVAPSLKQSDEAEYGGGKEGGDRFFWFFGWRCGRRVCLAAHSTSCAPLFAGQFAELSIVLFVHLGFSFSPYGLCVALDTPHRQCLKHGEALDGHGHYLTFEFHLPR